ncbi:hypothetical protein BLOT_000004 [Blomia tropicalis]|nr:hypothetical protein BLOT_000004 [Blomia tropicalis]
MKTNQIYQSVLLMLLPFFYVCNQLQILTKFIKWWNWNTIPPDRIIKNNRTKTITKYLKQQIECCNRSRIMRHHAIIIFHFGAKHSRRHRPANNQNHQQQQQQHYQ